MKTLIILAATIGALAAALPAEAAWHGHHRGRQVCHWGPHHHRVCHWVR
jgi:hypothetical protein